MAKKPVYALSVRQPWAWLIVNGWKNIENRTWPTKIRGPVLIHASSGMTRVEYQNALEFILHDFPTRIWTRISNTIPAFEDLPRGGIVGMAEIVGCVTESKSP